MRHQLFILVSAWLLAAIPLGSSAASKPFLPADQQVLETLPTALLAGRDELTALRHQLSNDPDNAELAAKVAEKYLQLGKAEGGPRFFGYARAAMATWWDQPSAPIEILRVRAKLKETNHNYAAALEDIERLIQQAPRDNQAWIERVNLLRVMGDYPQAWQAANQFATFADGVARVFCQAPLLALTGNAAAAAEIFDQALPVTRQNVPAALPWMLAQRAEIARALGDNDQAAQLLAEGLASHPTDGYLQRAYADLLLDQQRYAEVLQVTGNQPTDNGLLLAAAIAAHRQGDTHLAKTLQQQLAERFRETRLRGDLPHGRFEARFALHLQRDANRALELALANWQQQKERADARIVLQAAIAAGQPQAAEPVITFLTTAETQDAVLAKLLEELTGK